MANDEWQVCWHAPPRVTRASIERHGLDWRRMGATRGIAYGPGLPQEGREMECVFLLRVAWEVDGRGLSIEYPNDSWPFVLASIGPERVSRSTGFRPGLIQTRPGPVPLHMHPTLVAPAKTALFAGASRTLRQPQGGGPRGNHGFPRVRSR